MIVKEIPPFENFSDIMDLLASTPKLQERLKELKEMQDGVNASLGDLKEVQRIKGMKHAAEVALADAKEKLEAAEKEALRKVLEANKEIDKEYQNLETLKRHLAHDRQDLDRQIKENASLAATNKAHGQSLEDQQTLVDIRLKEAVAREKLADTARSDFNDRKAKVLEIFG